LWTQPASTTTNALASYVRTSPPGEIVIFDKAHVEVDGAWRIMVFITNNTTWSPRSVCDLYRRRWDIEVFFKQIKQSLKRGSFLGHSANAVKWQVYTALLV
jgi:IS4 transposase